jgi:signal transduction histidine kinase
MPIDLTTMSNALIIICGTIILMVTILVFFIALSRKRHNFFLQEKELLKSQHSEMLLLSQLEIQEQTSKQISYEIHDNIGQMLSLARLNLNSLKCEDITRLNTTDALLGSVIADLRNLSHLLNKDVILEKGLEVAVQQLLTSIQKTGKIKTAFESQITLELTDDTSIVVFRIIQESINNIIRHAEADTITVLFSDIGGTTRISIVDNGKGFQPENVLKLGGGTGLKNMLMRAKMIGAGIEIVSTPNNGTTIHIIVNPPKPHNALKNSNRSRR